MFNHLACPINSIDCNVLSHNFTSIFIDVLFESDVNVTVFRLFVVDLVIFIQCAVFLFYENY